MLLNGMTFASLGVLAAVLSKTHAGISRFSSFVLTPMSFLSNTFFDVSTMPGVFEKIIGYLPLTQSATQLRKVAWGETMNYLSVGLIVLYNVIFLSIAIYQINRMKNI